MLAACGDGASEPAYVVLPPFERKDAGVVVADASVEPGRDGSTALDAGRHEEDAGPLSQCKGDILAYAAAYSSGTIFSANLEGNRVHLAYLTNACGDESSPGGARAIAYSTFETTGEPAPPVLLGASEECWLLREPALVSSGGQVGVFYVSNDPGSFEILHYDLMAMSATRRTTNALAETRIAVAPLGGAEPPLLAYAALADVSGGSSSSTIRAGSGGQLEYELLPASQRHEVVQLTLATTSNTASKVAGAVAWYSNEASTAGAYLRFLENSGLPLGDIVTLHRQPAVGGSLASTYGSQAGALVYAVSLGDTKQGIQFRTLGPGQLLGDEVALTSANENVGDVAIAPFSHGYVVAYRRLGQNGQRPTIQLRFVDDQGRQAGASVLAADSVSSTGKLDLRVGRDGRVILLWSDTESVLDPVSGRAKLQVKVKVGRFTCLP